MSIWLVKLVPDRKGGNLQGYRGHCQRNGDCKKKKNAIATGVGIVARLALVLGAVGIGVVIYTYLSAS